ncbi:MAG: hypothetical protein LRY51_06300, partial [Geovibrio sp.]|nr:hypothetical protein [Geovibrio sp.]
MRKGACTVRSCPRLKESPQSSAAGGSSEPWQIHKKGVPLYSAKTFFMSLVKLGSFVFGKVISGEQEIAEKLFIKHP